MLEAIRQCVHVAKQTCNDLSAKRKSLPNGHTDGLVEDMIFKDIDYRDFFYMATLGGAEGKCNCMIFSKVHLVI